MNRFIIRIATILGAVLTVLIAVGVGFEILNMREFTKSSSTLNEFCGNLEVGTPQSKVSFLVQQQNGLRFTPMENAAVISLHACHCTARFKENKVFNVTAAFCNG